MGIVLLFGIKLVLRGFLGVEYIIFLVFVVVLVIVLLNVIIVRFFVLVVGVFLKILEGVLIVGVLKVLRFIVNYF